MAYQSTLWAASQARTQRGTRRISLRSIGSMILPSS